MTEAKEPWQVHEFRDLASQDDLGFHVRVRRTVVDNTVVAVDYEVRVVEEDDDSGAMVFQSESDCQKSTDPDVCSPVLSGYIKWDGCSNSDFGIPGASYHACSRQGMVRLGVLLDRLFDLALAMMPEREEYLC